MTTISTRIEDLILARGTRGIERVRPMLRPGYCARAARLLIDARAPVLIATGFPVGETFETDGPVGAIALYRVLDALGRSPAFVCEPPLSRVLAAGHRTHAVALAEPARSEAQMESLLARLKPGALLAIERPGRAADGRHYNMRGRDIGHSVVCLDYLFDRRVCPTIAVGDGGNEIGMGNVLPALSGLPIRPSATMCDELVIATVSNWGAYGIIAEICRATGQDLFAAFDPAEIFAHLVDRGAVDGLTGKAEASEDGFPLSVGLSLLAELRALCLPAAR
jgi:hypothetical protein